jgi:hypothetical protein
MRLSALKHLFGAVRALVPCDRVVVWGSASLLVRAPQLGATDAPLDATRAADLLVEPLDESGAAVLHEALGHGSLFEQRNGYHVDVLRPAIAGQLAPGWQERLVPVPGADAVALSAEDVAAAKLRVGRQKDVDVVRYLLDAGLVDGAAVVAHVRAMALSERELPAVLALLRLVGL